jgi:putative IMPACT (imprinted ancient) family translation regulator
MATRIYSNTTHSLLIKHSTFIAHLMRAMDFGEARLLITSLKAQHPMATHVTYAFRSATEERSSDAGEPAGSAGKVQLKILREKDLVDVVSVVIRYYGGTPLGLPGLTRAYGDALLGALGQTRLTTLKPVLAVTLRCPIAKLDVIKRRYGTLIDQLTFDEDGLSVTLRFLFPEQDQTDDLASLCSGHLTVVSKESVIVEV